MERVSTHCPTSIDISVTTLARLHEVIYVLILELDALGDCVRQDSVHPVPVGRVFGKVKGECGAMAIGAWNLLVRGMTQ